MAKDTDRSAGKLGNESPGGLLTGFLAEENEFDRRALWRLGSWGTAAVGAVIVAALANQSSIALRREQFAAADLTRQAQQLQSLTRDSQNETRRLASAVDTLNNDRDRLYSRVTVLEQGLESVTGAVARQSPAAVSSQQAAAKTASPATPDSPPAQGDKAPTLAAVATTAALAAETQRTEPSAPEKPQVQSQPASPPSSASSLPQAALPAPAAALPKVVSGVPQEPLTAPRSIMGPPDPAASKLMEPAKTTTVASPMPEGTASVRASVEEADTADGAGSKVQRMEFAVDLGSANSVGGLRALWRGVSKTNAELASLRPIIIIRERSSGLGMQLRLGAGPLSDAAAAAKICAALVESERGCDTTLFDGQRLSLQGDEKQETTPPAAPAAKPTPSRRSLQRHSRREEPAAAPVARAEQSSTLSSFFRR